MLISVFRSCVVTFRVFLSREQQQKKGPEIRSGFLADGKKTVELKRGDELELTTDYEFLGDSKKVGGRV